MKDILKSKFVPFALAFSVSLLATAPALAAQVSKTFTSGSTEIYTTTKKWTLFTKPATNYTIKLTGAGAVNIYMYTKTSSWGWTGPVYQTNISAGQTYRKTIKANAGDYKFLIQSARGGKKTVTIKSDGGSLR